MSVLEFIKKQERYKALTELPLLYVDSLLNVTYNNKNICLGKFYIVQWNLTLSEKFKENEKGLSTENFQWCLDHMRKIVTFFVKSANGNTQMLSDITEAADRFLVSVIKLTHKLSKNQPSLGFVWVKCSNNASLICSECLKEENHLRKCSKCNKTYYCSAECQQKHWDTLHKRRCSEKFIEQDFQGLINLKNTVVRADFSMVVIGCIVERDATTDDWLS